MTKLEGALLTVFREATCGSLAASSVDEVLVSSRMRKLCSCDGTYAQRATEHGRELITLQSS
eukprot:6182015-Pleurochrysis_carterae.AAC.3